LHQGVKILLSGTESVEEMLQNFYTLMQISAEEDFKGSAIASWYIMTHDASCRGNGLRDVRRVC
jgi:hypothetical protein